MKFMEKIWDNFGLFESNNKDEEIKKIEKPRIRRERSARNSNVIALPNLNSNNAEISNLKTNNSIDPQIKVVVVEPRSFDDTQYIADYLKTRKPVVLNFENTDVDVIRRIIDFISGTTYGLDGTIQKVGQNIFLCAPDNVDVSRKEVKEESSERGFFFWSKKGDK